MKSIRSLLALLTIGLVTTVGVCHAQQLTPGEGYVDVTGGKVWYRIVGNGPGTPLLVLHGGPGIPSFYLKPLAALGNKRPVIFYDQLGCGHSKAPDDTSMWTLDAFVKHIGEIRDALGLKEVCLYGHSWGALLAAEYLLTKPEGVKACIMAGPALDLNRWSEDADKLLATLPDSVRQVIRKHEADGTTDSPEYQAAMMVFYHKYLARKQPWSADIDSSFAMMNGAMYNYMEGPSEFTISGTLKGYDATPRLHEIKTPVLFIIGQHDEVTPETAKYYQSLVPYSEIAVLPNAGHLAMQDAPGRYMMVVSNFLTYNDSKK